MENIPSTELTTDQKLVILDQKLDYLVKEAVASSRMRKITITLTIIFVVLPIIIFAFTLPSIMSNLSSMYSI